jgi:hypothetical protein
VSPLERGDGSTLPRSRPKRRCADLGRSDTIHDGCDDIGGREIRPGVPPTRESYFRLVWDFAVLTDMDTDIEQHQEPSSSSGGGKQNGAENLEKAPQLGNLNVALVFLVSVGFLFFYYRHYSEEFSTWLAASAAGGPAALLVVLRWFGKRFGTRIGEKAERVIAVILAHRAFTVVLAVLLLTLLVLLATTSSIGLVYDKADETRRFVVDVKGRGIPFHTLRLEITPQHRVGVQRFHRLFAIQPIEFDLKMPAELGSPRPEVLAPWSRVRLPAPTVFGAPPIYPVFIVPGPRLMTFLPRDRSSATRRFYIRVIGGGQEWILYNIDKSSFVTGATLKELPRSIDPSVRAQLPVKYSARFRLPLEGASLEIVTSSVTPIASERMMADEDIIVEVGLLREDGARLPPVAVQKHSLDKLPTMAFVECNNERCD